MSGQGRLVEFFSVGQKTFFQADRGSHNPNDIGSPIAP